MAIVEPGGAGEPWPDRGLAASLALRWVESEPRARLVCTPNLRVIWANPAAREELGEGSDVELRGSTLTLRNRTSQNSFSAFLADCSYDLKSLCLSCEDGDGHLLVRARQLGETEGQRLIGLILVRTGSRFKAEYADIERVFQLTPAECRILDGLIDGHTVDGIAEHDRLSVETVRSHIRSIYGKMNVTSREALFFKIRPFRL